MIIGVGTDIVRIERIAHVVSKFNEKFLTRILSNDEIIQYTNNPAEKQIPFLAKRFAAKEAIAKALGTGIGPYLTFKDIVIYNNHLGAPFVTINREIAYDKNIMLSIADEIDVAIAFAIVSQ